MKTILSTKKLSSSQKKMFENANISLIEYDAIEINYLKFKFPKKISNGIFTSQNAVKAFFNHHNSNIGEIEKIFCVGEKTKAVLIKNNQKVAKMMQNASELAKFIANEYKNESFYFFCGSLRRDEIPATLKKENMTLFEVKTYETVLKKKVIHQKWDGILFFSPSGIQVLALKMTLTTDWLSVLEKQLLLRRKNTLAVFLKQIKQPLKVSLKKPLIH
jgi:uroporphyrinogen-III synthase